MWLGGGVVTDGWQDVVWTFEGCSHIAISRFCLQWSFAATVILTCSKATPLSCKVTSSVQRIMGSKHYSLTWETAQALWSVVFAVYWLYVVKRGGRGPKKEIKSNLVTNLLKVYCWHEEFYRGSEHKTIHWDLKAFNQKLKDVWADGQQSSDPRPSINPSSISQCKQTGRPHPTGQRLVLVWPTGGGVENKDCISWIIQCRSSPHTSGKTKVRINLLVSHLLAFTEKYERKEMVKKSWFCCKLSQLKKGRRKVSIICFPDGKYPETQMTKIVVASERRENFLLTVKLNSTRSVFCIKIFRQPAFN